MKIIVIAVGKLKDTMVKDKIGEYTKRLGTGVKVVFEEFRDNPDSIAKEGEKLLARIPSGARVIALDEKGMGVDSQGFSGIISSVLNSGKDLAFIIGGPYGLDQAVKEKADEVIALSKLTFPHELARLILMEQVYRAFTIIRNEPYHK
jgi:23S rRNA (pseudouridine1915-N3)-methyltransferase